MTPSAAPTRASIAPASRPGDYEVARGLFKEYAAALGVDLCFQGFDEELQRLPEIYGPPSGALLVARAGGVPAGTVAVRRKSADTCEMKRLYVRPAHRGTGLGRELAMAALAAASAMGYRRIVLDTLATMAEARGLYRALGFTEIPAYYDNPLPGTTYLERRLGG